MHPVGAAGGPAVAGIPLEFFLFAIGGVQPRQHSGHGAGIAGLLGHVQTEWVGLASLALRQGGFD